MHKIGEHIENMLVVVFGEIDYKKEPMDRNKVDYVARIFFPVAYIVFVILYILACVCPWAVEYNSWKCQQLKVKVIKFNQTGESSRIKWLASFATSVFFFRFCLTYLF